MQKIILYLCGFIFASTNIGIAQSSGLTKEQELSLEAEGLPIPGSPIKIVPRSQLGLSNKDEKLFATKSLQQLQIGRIAEYNARAKELLAIRDIIKQNSKKAHIVDTNYDSDLKSSINEIPMAYTFTTIPQKDTKIIGYAPMGTYLQNQGWTGAGVFFETSWNATCAFNESNLKITDGSAILPLEDVKYLINNKISLLNIMGNKQSGYVYEISWYDDSFRRKLECATPVFSKNIKELTINLAKEIDQGN